MRKNILAVTKILDSIGLQRPQATSLRSQMVDGRRDRAQIFLPGRGRFSDPGGGKFRLAGEEILGPEIRSRTGKSWGPEGQKVDVKKDLFFTLPGQIFALRRGQNPPKISDFGPPPGPGPQNRRFSRGVPLFLADFWGQNPPKIVDFGRFWGQNPPKISDFGPSRTSVRTPQNGGFSALDPGRKRGSRTRSWGQNSRWWGGPRGPGRECCRPRRPREGTEVTGGKSSA